LISGGRELQMKRPPNQPTPFRYLPHQPQKTKKAKPKPQPKKTAPFKTCNHPKVANYKKIQTPNQKTNPKHKKHHLKVATFATAKVATLFF
jgi:hypothetical protein